MEANLSEKLILIALEVFLSRADYAVMKTWDFLTPHLLWRIGRRLASLAKENSGKNNPQDQFILRASIEVVENGQSQTLTDQAVNELFEYSWNSENDHWITGSSPIRIRFFKDRESFDHYRESLSNH